MTECSISENAAVRLFLEVIALDNTKDEPVLHFSSADIRLIDMALSSHGKQPKHLLNMRSYSEIGISDQLDEQLAQTVGALDVIHIMQQQFSQWTRQGIGLIHRDDADYPAIWRERFGSTAPVIVWYAGNLALANHIGLAVTGSRSLTEDEEAYASRLGHECARQQITLISGYANGADQLTMFSALAEDGNVVGILSQGLLGVVGQARVRKPLQNGQLLLLSPYHPSAEFQATQALARNRLIYGMGKWAIAISSQEGTGGTWRGALECMVQKCPPLFVRSDQPISDGNAALLAMGALELDAESIGYGVKLAEHLDHLGDNYQPSDKAAQRLAEIGSSPDDFEALRRQPKGSSKPQPKTLPEELPAEMFEAAWVLMAPLLSEPQTPQQLAHALSITRAQALAWLKQAEGLGRVSRSGKPPKFIRTQQLFDNEADS